MGHDMAPPREAAPSPLAEPASASPAGLFDVDALQRDLDAIREAQRTNQDAEDLAHFQRIERAGRLFTVLGLALAWIPNPLSVLALAAGTFSRWTIVAHHVCHRGMDRVPGRPDRLDSRTFARGWRRLVDWMDWMHPEAWHQEHDVLHHYRLGEAHHEVPTSEGGTRPGDPDVPEDKSFFLRDSKLPIWMRTLVVLVGSTLWKPLYYAPNTMNELFNKDAPPAERFHVYDFRLWSPFSRRFWAVVFRCWLPYGAWRFGVLPALFLPLGTWAWAAALTNLVLAELLTNFWSFWIIVPNHTGDDLYRFDEPTAGRGEFYLHQILGSANYRTGGLWNDYVHGWLNYQIEHHLFPDLSPRQYALIQPEVKAVCERHGVPYVQQSAFARARKCMSVLVGRSSMKVYEEAARDRVALDAAA